MAGYWSAHFPLTMAKVCICEVALALAKVCICEVALALAKVCICKGALALAKVCISEVTLALAIPSGISAGISTEIGVASIGTSTMVLVSGVVWPRTFFPLADATKQVNSAKMGSFIFFLREAAAI